MSGAGRLDPRIAAWLDEEASGHPPFGILEAVETRARGTRQRPAWVAVAGGAGEVRGRSQAVRIAVTCVVAVLLVLLGIAIAGVARPSRSGVRNGSILAAFVGPGADPAAMADYVVMDAHGGTQRSFFRASECGQCAFWSPDGTQIMIPEPFADGRLGTALVRADGTAKIVLQPFPDTTLNLGPAGWAPDGRSVALAGWDDTAPALRGIYVAGADGTGLRQVTTATDGTREDFATFSADGRWIVFHAADPALDDSLGMAGDLYVVRADGSGRHRLNPGGTHAIETAGVGRSASWAPDVARVAFVAVDDRGRGSIYVADAAGGDPATVAGPFDGLTSVAWSPDGAWLLLSRATGDGAETVELVRPGDGAVVPLVSGAADDPSGACCGTWAPDATRILVQRGVPGHRTLWTLGLDGRFIEQLTRTPGTYLWYSWARQPPASDLR